MGSIGIPANQLRGWGTLWQFFSAKVRTPLCSACLENMEENYIHFCIRSISKYIEMYLGRLPGPSRRRRAGLEIFGYILTLIGNRLDVMCVGDGFFAFQIWSSGPNSKQNMGYFYEVASYCLVCDINFVFADNIFSRIVGYTNHFTVFVVHEKNKKSGLFL